MLNTIHAALDTLLRNEGKIDAFDVDVSFDVPSDAWVGSVTKPTIDLFLFDVSENTDKRETNPQLNVNGGRAERRMPPRRIDLWYMVSVLTTEVADEHELLWRVLAILLRYERFPSEVLPDSLRSLAPPMSARMATRDESPNLLDLWSALGAKPRPALCYVLTAPLDLALSIEAPLVLTRTARYRRMTLDAEIARDVGVQIGGTVRDAAGRPLASVRVVPRGSGMGAVTGLDGRYALHGLSEGRMTLRIVRDGGAPRDVEFDVPGVSYDIVLDG
jgi:hypothetical protein